MSVTTAPTDRAPRPGLRAWATLFVAEAKMVMRDTSGFLVPLGLPLLILVMSAAPAAAENAGNGLTGLEQFVLPLVFAMVLCFIGVLNMPSFLAYYRSAGILRRLAVTPASPAMVLIAQALVSMAQAVFGIGLALAVAVLGFGAQLPSNGLLMVGVFLLALGGMYGIGMMVAALAPTPNSAVAIGLLLFFAFGALGGMFGGTSVLPDVLAEIGRWLPFSATVEVVSQAWAGTGIELFPVMVLAGSMVGGAVVAALFFRWE